ncbi:hypothetical protein BDF21DRAFT_464083 [Thamnidium elegans]|nr:hypothetical protein BDF21DRAFT_464083 [Thamnidium elegans]
MVNFCEYSGLLDDDKVADLMDGTYEDVTPVECTDVTSLDYMDVVFVDDETATVASKKEKNEEN